MMKCHGGPNKVFFFVQCGFLCGVQLLHILDSPLKDNISQPQPPS